jgi:hypothetical protein
MEALRVRNEYSKLPKDYKKVENNQFYSYNCLYSRGQPTRGDPVVWGLGKGLQLLTVKKKLVKKRETGGGGDSCEHRNEPSDSTKGGEFLGWLSDYQFLKKDSAPWN